MPTVEQHQQMVRRARRAHITSLAISLGVDEDQIEHFIANVDALANLDQQRLLVYDADTGECITPKVAARGGVDGARTKIAAQNLPGTTPELVDLWYGRWLRDDKPPAPAASPEPAVITVELSKTDRELLQAIVSNTEGFHVIATHKTGLLGRPILYTGEEN